jgi:hypothetical protein
LKTIVILSTLCLASCVIATGTTDIVPIGKDTYMLGRPGGFFTRSGGEVKSQLFRDANAFCRNRGLNLMPVSTSERDTGIATYANAEIQFRCLVEGDPDLGRPTMKSAPNVTVEVAK